MDTEGTEAKTESRDIDLGAVDTIMTHNQRKQYILNLCWHTDTLAPKNLDQYVHWEMVAAMTPNPDGMAAGYIKSSRKKLDASPFTPTLKALEEKHGMEFGYEPLGQTAG